MDVIVRTATVEDTWGIAHVHVESWRETYQGIVSDEYLNSILKNTKVKKSVRPYFKSFVMLLKLMVLKVCIYGFSKITAPLLFMKASGEREALKEMMKSVIKA